jgi:hypothetical protein
MKQKKSRGVFSVSASFAPNRESDFPEDRHPEQAELVSAQSEDL